MDQRSKEWFEQRLGKFTASSIDNLMGIKGLGDTGMTECFTKATEIVFGRDESWEFQDRNMRRGAETEPEAFDRLKSIMAIDFLTLEECSFFPLEGFSADAGASPDGIVIGKPIQAEIKCPNPKTIFKLMVEGEKAIPKSHMHQMQMQMACTKSEVCYYFNYAIWQDNPIWHLIKVARNQDTIDKIIERIKEAVKHRDEFVEQLQTNKQF